METRGSEGSAGSGSSGRRREGGVSTPHGQVGRCGGVDVEEKRRGGRLLLREVTMVGGLINNDIDTIATMAIAAWCPDVADSRNNWGGHRAVGSAAAPPKGRRVAGEGGERSPRGASARAPSMGCLPLAVIGATANQRRQAEPL